MKNIKSTNQSLIKPEIIQDQYYSWNLYREILKKELAQDNKFKSILSQVADIKKSFNFCYSYTTYLTNTKAYDIKDLSIKLNSLQDESNCIYEESLSFIINYSINDSKNAYDSDKFDSNHYFDIDFSCILKKSFRYLTHDRKKTVMDNIFVNILDHFTVKVQYTSYNKQKIRSRLEKFVLSLSNDSMDQWFKPDTMTQDIFKIKNTSWVDQANKISKLRLMLGNDYKEVKLR